VMLDGSASAGGDGAPLRYTWEQKDGPAVAFNDAHLLKPTFTAPAVPLATAVTLQLTVTDGTTSNSATLTIAISPGGPLLPPPPTDSGQAAAAWANASDNVEATVNWFLPASRLDSVTTTRWDSSGTSVGTLRVSQIPDGLHRLTFYLDGNGRS